MKEKTFFRQWVYTLVFLSMSMILLNKKTYAIALGLLALTALIFLIYGIITNRKSITPRDLFASSHGKIISTFALFTGSSVFFYFYHNENLSYLDKPLKLILFILVLLLLVQYPVKLKIIIIATITSSIISFCVAFYDVYFIKQRAFFVMNAIQGGDIAMSLGLFNTMFCFYLAKINDKKLLVMTLIAAVMGISASLLSSSRGSLVCLPLLMLILLFIYRGKLLTKKGILYSTIIVLFCAVLLGSNPKLTNRFVVAKNEIQMYYNNINKKTSVGYRLELWKSAMLSWQEKPFMGWGEQNIRLAKKRQGEENKILPTLHKLKFHAHNQFLEELSVRGLLGFFTFMGLLLTPFLVFAKYRRHENKDTRILSYLGMLHIFLISTYCLTQTFFAHNSGILFYALITVVFYSSLYGTLHKKTT